MRKSAILWASLVVGALAAAGQTPSPAKVGIINLQNAIMATNDGKKAAADLEAKSAPKKRELEKLQSDIAGLRDQYNKTSSVGSEEQKGRLQRDIDAKTKNFNRQVEDAQAELDQEQNRILNEIAGRMLQVLNKYSTDNGYAIVLDISNQNTPVMFASNNIDVTQEIVGLYDKNSPGLTSATGGAGTPSVGGRTTPMPAATRPAPGVTRPATQAPKPGGVK